MKYFIIAIFFFMILFYYQSCGNFEALEVRAANKQIIMENNSGQEIFYFLVEQNCAAVINWGATIKGPKIEPAKSVSVPYDSVLNCLADESVKKNDKVIIYWWYRNYQETNILKNLLIELK